MNPRSQETLSELQRLSVSPDVQEGSSPAVRRLATVALEQEAELAVTKQALHKALATQKLTPTSRKVLSRARQATRRDLLNARYAREYAESGGRKGKGKGKAKQTKEKTRSVRRTRIRHTLMIVRWKDKWRNL
jgi:SOS response regulatory protein OraA/RecX